MKFWDYNKFFSPPVGAENQITLGEGSTPVYSLVPVLSNAFAKLESLNPTGTHKDRSLAYWLSFLKEGGIKKAVISSSGNSAISASLYAPLAGIKLTVFVSPRITDEKRKKLENSAKKEGISVVMSRFPKKDAFLFAKKTGAYFLRSSYDEKAAEGYKTIAFEITEQIPECGAIFIPTSSGTTAKGIYEGFLSLGVSEEKMPKFFIAQTSAVHSIAAEFDRNFTPEKRSLASSIVDKIARRKNEIVEIIEKTKGGGVVVSNNELKEAARLLEAAKITSGLTPGWESIMTVAAVLKTKPAGAANIVCLFTS